MSPFKDLFSCLPCKKQKEKKVKEKEKKSKTKQDVEMRPQPVRRNSLQGPGFKSIGDRMSQLNESARWKKPEEGNRVSLKEKEPKENNTSSLDISLDVPTPRKSTRTSFPVTPKNPEYPFKKEDEFADFSKFAEANDFITVLKLFSEICEKLDVDIAQSKTYHSVFASLREKLKHRIPNNCDKLLNQLEVRGAKGEYEGNGVAKGKKVLVIGAGPCGLRLAMEAQFLGAETTVVEARTDLTRNNVLKLWTFVMEDLKNLGAKSLYNKLEHGSINHISIWKLQLILVKMALLLGAQVRAGETFKSLIEPNEERGWVVIIEKMEEGRKVEMEEEYDIVICASGRKVPLDGFDRNQPETKMAIAITANWKNLGSPEEKAVKEIPGLSWQNDREFFQNLDTKHGINLENIVHFKDLTHYFVMTAKKESLLTKGVLLNARDRDNLLSSDNIDYEALEKFALEAARFSTAYFSTELPSTPLEDRPAIFDFTHLYRSKNASRVKQVKGHKLLLGLVGDSLQQPFWPEGLGISRGFLSVFDTAWMIKQFCGEISKHDQVYDVIREREKNYILQKTADNNLKDNYAQWSINPSTRYPVTNTSVSKERVKDLYDMDEELS